MKNESEIGIGSVFVTDTAISLENCSCKRAIAVDQHAENEAKLSLATENWPDRVALLLFLDPNFLKKFLRQKYF